MEVKCLKYSQMQVMCRFIVVLIAFVLVSCKNQHVDKENPLYKEVMVIHDKVMPEMSTIHQLKKQLKALDVPAAKKQILDQINQLNDADEAMMSWMAAFVVPKEQTQIDAYLKSEKGKIQGVSDQMYAAMTHAKQLIDSLSTTNPTK